jgi:hypothetical protein
MDIAILRTTEADTEAPRYSQLEYLALLRGARAVTYACLPDHPHADEATFRDLPQHPLRTHARMPNIDLLAAASAASADLRGYLGRSGWPARRVAYFGDDRTGSLVQFAQGRFLVHRKSELHEIGLRQQRHAFEMQGPGIDDVTPALSYEDRLAVTERVLAACRVARGCTPSSGRYVVGENWGCFLQHTRPHFYAALNNGDVNAMEALLADPSAVGLAKAEAFA